MGGMRTEATSGTLQAALTRDVTTLAKTIGERNTKEYANLGRAADFVTTALSAAGYKPRRQEFQADGRIVSNIEAELPGGASADEIVIIGAHYDSVPGTPGADDNASGVAAMLAIARAMAGEKPARTVRFVAFVNEEPPFFQTDLMGSVVYARRCRQRGENIAAMLCLEMLGYYSDEKGSQKYPNDLLKLVFPSEGNFIAFVGNADSNDLLARAHARFGAATDFPSQKAALPPEIPGVGFSDHWSFWQEDYPAVMVTDTAHLRNPHYHEPSDTPDKVDFESMARVVAGLEAVARGLAADDASLPAKSSKRIGKQVSRDR
jgi:Zn-dependent M28 family amino/carboxypeptidase